MQFSNDEMKIIGISGPIFVKMLRDRERKLLDKIYGAFRNGQKDFLTDIAEFAVIREQISEITSALKRNDNEGA